MGVDGASTSRRSNRIISDDVVQNVSEFVSVLEEERVTRIVMLPSYLSVILDSVDRVSDRLLTLRVCAVSGEPLNESVARQFLSTMKHCLLMNLYGSTEVSADVTASRVRLQDIDVGISIGRPIHNCQVYILDSAQQLMPFGAVGELCVAGRGLSLGYFGENDSLNHEKFLPNPFGEGKLYLTGDLGRFRTDGTIEHCGRKDAQIKIRGHRIEPAEIERIITSFDGVRSALVNAPGDNALYAYYRVNQGSEIVHEQLESYVRHHLPDYMVPQALLLIDDLPRLPNGKINRSALPVPGFTSSEVAVEPRTETERKIAQIWKSVLGVETVSVLDRFESSGGSSLTGMRLNAHIMREFGVTILPRMLLTATLSQIASHVNPEDVVEHDDQQTAIGLVEPVYFGEQGNRLFGVAHIPAVPAAGKAVLLCSSIGHEYMRLYRGQQSLATELCQQGYYVFRFDYFGVGDSQGESHEATLAEWVSNTNAAMQFLREKSGVSSITVIAIRMGAPIALNARLTGVERLVLWDPVFSGQRYWEYLGRLHRFALKNLDRYRYKQYRSGLWERFGYSYSEELVEELKAVKLSALLDRLPANVHVVTTGAVDNSDGVDINSISKHPSVTHRHLPELDIWSEFEQASYLAFVQLVLDQILDILRKEG